MTIHPYDFLEKDPEKRQEEVDYIIDIIGKTCITKSHVYEAIKAETTDDQKTLKRKIKSTNLPYYSTDLINKIIDDFRNFSGFPTEVDFGQGGSLGPINDYAHRLPDNDTSEYSSSWYILFSYHYLFHYRHEFAKSLGFKLPENIDS